MKQIFSYTVLVLTLAVTLSSCELVGDIFRAGFYSAFIVLIVVVLLVIWLLRKFRRRS